MAVITMKTKNTSLVRSCSCPHNYDIITTGCGRKSGHSKSKDADYITR